LVEAGGQLFHLFRDRLDYAFILSSLARWVGCGACYRQLALLILVPALPVARFSQSMSLYRAERVGLVPPLGVARPLLPAA